MGEPPDPDGEILEEARALLGDREFAPGSYPELVRRLCDELRRSGRASTPEAPGDRRRPARTRAAAPEHDGAYYRRALDALTEAFAILEPVRDESGGVPDFRVTYANRVAADCARMRHDEAVGRLVSKLIPGAGPAGLLDLYRRVLRTGRPAVLDDFELAEPGGDPDDPPRLSLRVSRIETGLAVKLAGPVDTDDAPSDRPAESATKPVLVKWIVDNLEKSDGSRYDAAEFKTTTKPALWELINAADEDDKSGPDADTAELVDWLEDHGDYDRAELEAQSDDQLRELIEATEV